MRLRVLSSGALHNTEEEVLATNSKSVMRSSTRCSGSESMRWHCAAGMSSLLTSHCRLLFALGLSQSVKDQRRRWEAPEQNRTTSWSRSGDSSCASATILEMK